VVILNGCATGTAYVSLTGQDSFAHRFLQVSASAFVGTMWPIEDRVAQEFASLFYSELARGREISVAFLAAKTRLRQVRDAKGRERTGDERVARNVAVRSYCLFASPGFKIAFAKAA
jgi:CHAT domain-containing protein